uniref:Nonstructural protein n=1 Tax=Dendrocopos leucotos parvoviridae sp. TaxID=2794475 RepID=A0A8A4XE29_9VIRU|nr:MAG: nonstructural protein [Dendrocopos leucotos parvoviridae sp.]
MDEIDELVDNTLQLAQEVRVIPSWSEYKRDDERAEFEEAGYSGDPIYDPITGTAEPVIEECEGRGGDGGQVSIVGSIIGGAKQLPVFLEVLGVRLIAELVKSIRRNGQRRLVRESIRGERPRIYTIINGIRKSLYKKGTFFAIAYHGSPSSHYHVIHACPWKWYCCRCYQPPGGKRNLRTTELTRISESDWNSEFEYLCSDDRQLQYVYSGVTYTKSLCGIKYIPIEGIHEEGATGEMEVCQNQNEGVPESERMAVDSGTSEHVVGSNSHLPKSSNKIIPEEVEAFIMNNLCVPIDSITVSHCWISSKYRFIGNDHKVVNNVIRSVKNRINTWMYEDFKNFYNNRFSLQFAAFKESTLTYYYLRDESAEIIEKLLLFQYLDLAAANGVTVEEQVTLFLQEVYDICFKKKAKVNALELIGPASCGKSFFCDMVANFFINVGLIENFDRYHQFPLQSAFNKRILQWNEAQCEHAKLEIAKLVLGGDPCPANIKYSDIQTISRTPVLITANRQFIPNTQPFNDRMIRYTWRPAPFLKQYDRKPHPLCLLKLFEDYPINK